MIFNPLGAFGHLAYVQTAGHGAAEMGFLVSNDLMHHDTSMYGARDEDSAGHKGKEVNNKLNNFRGVGAPSWFMACCGRERERERGSSVS